MVVIETVGVGQAETEVADVADTVAVVVQPGSGDVLQFLKSGIMEIPDVLVVTKADLGQIAMRTRRDLSAALRSLGSRRDARAWPSPRSPPPSGIEELVERARASTAPSSTSAERRLRARRAGALRDFAAEHGERGLRALGGRARGRAAARRAGPAARHGRAGGGARASALAMSGAADATRPPAIAELSRMAATC